MAARLLEREPQQKEFPPLPADGAAPSTNPPPFRWLLHDGVSRWRVLLNGPRGAREEYGPLADPILSLPHPLAPGSWRWRYVGLDANGRETGKSLERTFTLRRGLSGVCLPELQVMERRVRGLKPRLFGQRIAAFKLRRPAELAGPFNQLALYCRLAEQAQLAQDPAPFGLHKSDTEAHNRDWVRIYSAGKIGSAHALRFALSFLLTQNKRHLECAKRHALNLVDWNPWGATSLHANDEAGMPMLERLSLVYDWLRPHWTPEERSRYLACMLLRGEEAMELNRKAQFAARPFNNHQCRTLAFQGLAGVAFLGEIPQAGRWLQHVLNMLAVSYPSASWGSDDGGWAQGLSYWSAYMSWLIEFVAAMKELGVDFSVAPYFAHTGYFPLYHLPAYAPRGGFGDHGEGGPGFGHKLVVGSLAALAGDGCLKAYADGIKVPWLKSGNALAVRADEDPAKWDPWLVPDVLALLLLPDAKVKSRPIRSLPPAHQFPNIGWAAMHSALGEPRRDTWLQFKSSPFGSISHSHADQNSFNLFAFGEALLLDSGYYPWYGSPHDTLWTRQSWAHNMVLIAGHGQPPFDWFARGKLEAFTEAFPFCYVRGEAAAAYNRPADKGAQALARAHRPALLKNMGPAVTCKQASRSALMVAGETPFYVILDQLSVSRPVRFQWLAHAFQRMRIHTDSAGFNVARNKARLAVRFACPTRLKITQHERFPIAPEGRAKGAPNQWHLQAETLERANAGRFLTVLVPFLAANRAPVIRRLEGPQAVGLQVGSAVVLAPQEQDSRRIRYENIEADAELVAVCRGKVFAAEATRLKLGSALVFDSPVRRSIVHTPATAENNPE